MKLNMFVGRLPAYYSNTNEDALVAKAILATAGNRAACYIDLDNVTVDELTGVTRKGHCFQAVHFALAVGPELAHNVEEIAGLCRALKADALLAFDDESMLPYYCDFEHSKLIAWDYANPVVKCVPGRVRPGVLHFTNGTTAWYLS